jgi:hypothetical protein
MAAFTNLSDDLIYHLALPFQHDRSTLHALNLVSRALHRATLALLFRHTSQLTLAQNHLLHRTLSENPELKRYVHSCSVAIDHGKLDDAQLAWILALSNVRDLTVRRYDALQRTGNYWTDIRNASQLYRFGRSVECDFECGFLDKYEWKGVRSVCLQGGFTGTEIVRFVQLPDIRSLEATVLHIVNAPRVPDSPGPRRSRRSNSAAARCGAWSRVRCVAFSRSRLGCAFCAARSPWIRCRTASRSRRAAWCGP